MWKQGNNNIIAAAAAATTAEAADSGASGGSNNNDENNKKQCESFSVFFLIRNCKAKQKTGKRVIFYCSLLAYVAVAMSPIESVCLCVLYFLLNFWRFAFFIIIVAGCLRCCCCCCYVDDAGADVDAGVAAELLAF